MFVPDDTNGAKVMHVLMPRVDHGNTPPHGGHERHFVKLAYFRANAVEPGAGPAVPISLVDLDGYRIRIGAKPGTAETKVIPADIVLLDRYVGFSGVDRACTTPDGEHRLASRVELRAGKITHAHKPDVEYCIATNDPSGPTGASKERCHYMAEHVDWELQVPGTTANLASLIKLEPFAGTGAPELPTLRPDNNNVVHIGLVHVVDRAVPKNNIPSNVEGNSDAHFSAYYDLSRPPAFPRTPRRKPTKMLPDKDPSATCMTSRASFA